MSSICFRDFSGEAKVGGRERAMCGLRVQRMFEVFVDLRGLCFDERRRAAILRAFGETDERMLQYVLRASEAEKLIAGRTWNMMVLAGNTIQVCGSDVMRLVARIHNQCEIHGWVDGPDRAWLATMIEEALAVGVMREETQGYGKGWRDVVALLRARSDDMVVMSYSVCDGFPNPGILDLSYEDENWADLSAETRWNLCTAVLRSSHPLLRMDPANWSTYYYCNKDDAFTLVRALEVFK